MPETRETLIAMTQNPPNPDLLPRLVDQISSLAKNGDSVPDIQWVDGCVAVFEENRKIQQFSTPIKLGTVLNFIRRHQNRSDVDSVPDIIELGAFRFEPRQSALTRPENGDTIILTDKERDILVALWLAPEKSLSRDALLAKVWAYADGVETHTLETHIYRLRQKIEADPTQPELLVNVAGAYCLNA